MQRLAIAATAAVMAFGLAAGPATPARAADPGAPLPEEWLGELADARTLLDTLEDGGTSAAALAPARDALECWAAAGADALTCRDDFFARVVDSSWKEPQVRAYALAQADGVDLWMD